METLKNINDNLKSSLKGVMERNIQKDIISGIDYIPVTGKKIDENDLLYAVDATLDGWLTTGRYSKEFEYNLAKYIGAKKSILLISALGVL